ncbi:hypothetical protein RCL1_001972 [Eukaryota sp. TZLM3-RCL]
MYISWTLVVRVVNQLTLQEVFRLRLVSCKFAQLPSLLFKFVVFPYPSQRLTSMIASPLPTLPLLKQRFTKSTFAIDFSGRIPQNLDQMNTNLQLVDFVYGVPLTFLQSNGIIFPCTVKILQVVLFRHELSEDLVGSNPLQGLSHSSLLIKEKDPEDIGGVDEYKEILQQLMTHVPIDLQIRIEYIEVGEDEDEMEDLIELVHQKRLIIHHISTLKEQNNISAIFNSWELPYGTVFTLKRVLGKRDLHLFSPGFSITGSVEFLLKSIDYKLLSSNLDLSTSLEEYSDTLYEVSMDICDPNNPDERCLETIKTLVDKYTNLRHLAFSTTRAATNQTDFKPLSRILKKPVLVKVRRILTCEEEHVKVVPIKIVDYQWFSLITGHEW